MHKRVISFLLSAAILLGLFCGAVPTAYAASDMSISSKGIDMIKYFEGFSKYPYYDYGQYTVGYGTRVPDGKLEEYNTNGISEKEAEALLKEFLESFEKSLNSFADKHKLSWNQGQFDALMSFTFNCGTNWMTSSSAAAIRSAVVNKDKGNDFIFALGRWCTASGKVLPALVNRRLIEANMYLNGVYSTKVPSNYRYVIFDDNLEGATNSVRVQAYDASVGDSIRSSPVAEGNNFTGWYTKAFGGNQVTWLDENVTVTTLYAHWGNVVEAETPIATGTINTTQLRIRSGPGTSYDHVGYIYEGERVEIFETRKSGSATWGRIEQGWISLTYVDLDKTAPETPEQDAQKVIATGTITASKLNIRSGAGTGYSSVGYVYEGETVQIYETKTSGGTTWGRIENGWISMEYVALKENGGTSDAPEKDEQEQDQNQNSESVMTGTVAVERLNVRTGAGTSNTLAGYIYEGETVKILETKSVSGITWGRIDKGWISLEYIDIGINAPEVTVSNVASSGKISLSWTAVENATGYQIHRATSKTGEYELIKTTDSTSFVNTGAKAGKTYYYYIQAVMDGGIRSAKSKIVSRTCDLASPEVSLSNVASFGKIKISWKSVDSAVKYEVYRATSKDGEYKRLTTTSKTQVTNTSAEAGKVYYYKVRAIAANSAANSAYSSVKYRTCDVARPEVTLTNVASTGKIRISWEAVEGAVKYEVYRATSKDGTYKRLTTTSKTQVTNTSTDAGKTYYYKVIALAEKSAANSAASSVKSRTCDLARPVVSVELNAGGKPFLKWEAVEGAVKYKVYRATSKNGSYSLLKTVTGTSFTNTTAKAGTTYYYKVVAVASKTAANSANSAVVSMKSN